jgi:hypothetical protein
MRAKAARIQCCYHAAVKKVRIEFLPAGATEWDTLGTFEPESETELQLLLEHWDDPLALLPLLPRQTLLWDLLDVCRLEGHQKVRARILRG